MLLGRTARLVKTAGDKGVQGSFKTGIMYTQVSLRDVYVRTDSQSNESFLSFAQSFRQMNIWAVGFGGKCRVATELENLETSLKFG